MVVHHWAGLTFADIGRGVVDGLWFLSSGLIVTQAVRLLGGPLSTRADSADAYYVLLARLPWMEAGVALSILAVALALLGGRTRPDRRVVAGGVAALAVLSLVLGGVNPVALGAAAVAIGLSLTPGLAARTTWGGWVGLIALILIIGSAAQAAAPETAFLFVWPALLAAAAACGVAFLNPDLNRAASLAPIALVAVLGGAWLIGLSHPVFLGIGMDLPGVLALMGLLVLMLVRPLDAGRGAGRALLMAGLAVLMIGAGVSFTARIAHPMAEIEAARTIGD